MNKEEKLKVFEKELGYIKDNSVFEKIESLVAELPDYFFVIPASSSGKYHPENQIVEGGLVVHTKVTIAIAHSLLQLEQYKELNELFNDEIIGALILHDGYKNGYENSGHTVFEHPLLMAKKIKETYNTFRMRKVADLVASHMGQWNTSNYSNIILPKPCCEEEKFVHMCDYLGSRKNIIVQI